MKLSRLFRHLPQTLPARLPRLLRNDRQQAVDRAALCQKTYLKLFQLKRAHRLMWLRVEGDDDTYQTVILHVDTVEPFILIDEPFPVDGVLEGLIGKTVVLTFNEERGQQQSMTCTLLGKAGDSGSGVYQLSYPESVGVEQRREMYRLPVQATQRVRLSADSLKNSLEHCAAPQRSVSELVPVVMDISASGMRWAIAGNCQKYVHAGAFLTSLDVSVLGCGEFTVGFEVSHSCWVPGVDSVRSDYTVIGGSFVGLDAKQKQQLERYITLVQRQQCREKRDERLLAA